MEKIFAMGVLTQMALFILGYFLSGCAPTEPKVETVPLIECYISEDGPHPELKPGYFLMEVDGVTRVCREQGMGGDI